jgi:hypothetical protein
MQRRWLLVCMGGLGASAMCACFAGGDPEPMAVKSRDEAVQIARKAFIDATGGKVAKFKVSDSAVKPPDGQWRFFVEGVDEFARPGYHATVTVDKKTGKATVTMGE